MHNITIAITSHSSNSKPACCELGMLIESMVPGEKVGAQGEDMGIGYLFNVDEENLARAMEGFHEEPSLPPRFFQSALYSDNEAFLADVRDLAKPTIKDPVPFHAKWGDIVNASMEAIKALDALDLPRTEIHVFDGKVRAMTSEHYGRRDSGWFKISQA